MFLSVKGERNNTIKKYIFKSRRGGAKLRNKIGEKKLSLQILFYLDTITTRWNIF